MPIPWEAIIAAAAGLIGGITGTWALLKKTEAERESKKEDFTLAGLKLLIDANRTEITDMHGEVAVLKANEERLRKERDEAKAAALETEGKLHDMRGRANVAELKVATTELKAEQDMHEQDRRHFAELMAERENAAHCVVEIAELKRELKWLKCVIEVFRNAWPATGIPLPILPELELSEG